MLLLHDSSKLLTLYKSLARSIPESLKVYGSVYHINHGNPFNLEVLVDSWPEYQTVIVRPQKQEMIDDKNLYINRYCIFSKEPQKLQDVLKHCGVINWKQMFQIEGFQESLGEGIKTVAFPKSVRVEYLNLILYVTADIMKLKAANESKPGSWLEADHPDHALKSEDLNLKFSRLNVSHCGLVNDCWSLGQNERSLRYIQRCIQTLPSYCVLGPEGTPVTWSAMDPTSEIVMGYTLERYRNKGIMRQMMMRYMTYLRQENIPFYLSVLADNENSHRVVKRSGFSVASCAWHQWTCYPQE
ncbi:PREDICTED: glycine N-acyltransferase-like protein 1 [Hipposideros armiger]|uniref:Glycine N-acyltransferase-like protein n=1 Tax=Hipposideros armiger TaxID=186990 RepID=A0A8B7SI47_HIPAR|nr:PREDICTED: glycine N-acyltransferase-like protein 1 [Hipposideros armiger]